MDTKQHDVRPLTWDLGEALDGFTSVKAILRHEVTEAKIEIAGVISGSEVTIEPSAEQTAVPGDYQLEFELLPGPITWPSVGYGRLTVRPDLG